MKISYLIKLIHIHNCFTSPYARWHKFLKVYGYFCNQFKSCCKLLFVSYLQFNTNDYNVFIAEFYDLLWVVMDNYEPVNGSYEHFTNFLQIVMSILQNVKICESFYM